MPCLVSMRRLHNVTDALSQFGNALLLPRPWDTDANESISGRSYREGWRLAERIINVLIFWDADHCRRAYERDMERARKLVSKC